MIDIDWTFLTQQIKYAIYDGVRDGLRDAAASKPKRGPTPCETCRWFVDRRNKDYVDANGVSRIPNFCTEKPMHNGVPFVLLREIEPVGCPQHDEKP